MPQTVQERIAELEHMMEDMLDARIAGPAFVRIAREHTRLVRLEQADPSWRPENV